MSAAAKIEHRRRLLDAAAAEFAAKGLDGARVDDISLNAGLAKGTIYNYFDSKQDVFRAVIEQWFTRIDAERADVPADAPVREQLLALVQADIAVTADLEEFARVAYGEVLRPSADAAALLPDFDIVDAELAAIVERGQESGEIRTDRSASELARMFTTLVTGLLVEHWLPGSDLAIDDIPSLAIDYYLDGARA